MGAITIGQNLFIDGMRPGGADAALDGTTSTSLSSPVSFVAGDVLTLKLWFRERATDGGASTAMTIPSGSVIVVGGKLASSAGELLFSATSFAADGDGYIATLDLNTTPISTALSSTSHGGHLDIFVDIEVQNAGNTARATYRVNGRLYKQVYAGETSPSSVVTPTPVLLSPDGSRWQITASNDGELTLTKVA
jgi:hypothetical protein